MSAATFGQMGCARQLTAVCAHTAESCTATENWDESKEGGGMGKTKDTSRE